MGMDLRRMAEQVQRMQQDMARVQAELDAAVVEGSAGGGVVTVTVSGNPSSQEVLSLRIEPDAVDPNDVEMLQDLVLAAVNEALWESRKIAEAKLGKVTGGLQIPGL